VQLLSSQPVRRQIVAISILLVIPFAILTGWSAVRSRAEREKEVEEQATSVAATATAYLNQYLSSIDTLASVLSRYPSVMALDGPGIDQLCSSVLADQPLLLNIGVVDTKGMLVGSGLDPRGHFGPWDFMLAAVRSGKPLVSELQTGELSGKPTVLMLYPLTNDARQIIGVMGFAVNLQRLQTVFGSIPLPEGSVITLTDSASRVLARSREPERYIGTVIETSPRAPKDVQGQARPGLDGVARFFGNAPIARGPWVLSVGIPLTVAMDRVRPLWVRNLAIVLGSIAVVLGMALWFSYRLNASLGALRAAAQRIASGDLSAPEKVPVDSLELSELQDAFGTMAGNLREMHRALDRQVEQERKVREALQSLQRQVVRQERLAAVGLLVSGVAHELNNPLQAILGTAELLEREERLSPEAQNEIAFVKTQSGRAREIIRNLSRFSSQQSGPPQPVDLREVISEVEQLRARELMALSIVLQVDAPPCRHVQANFTEIEQVILNFVINAQQSIEGAYRESGRILIRVIDNGKRVRLEVHDDGPGVKPHDEPKLFQPFFTTKPVGKGTGLGLSVSYGIIDSFGGTIGYNENSWGGATFFFELPAVDPSGRPPNDDQSSVLHGTLPS